jgi:GT2 family glycosyltransferase
MNVTVVIVTYNGEQWLTRCLKSVFASTIPINVVVVDNYSTDKTFDIINQFPGVKLIRLNENSGFGHANNIGLSEALSKNMDYVFLLNQDAYLEETTIERLIDVHQNHKAYGILSPIHLNGNGLSLDINFSNYLRSNKSIIFDALKTNRLKAVYDVPFVNAAGWLIPKQTLLDIGGFDPIFYHYGEDVNYCQRILFHGFKIGVVPDAFMRHDRDDRYDIEFKTLDDPLKLVERKLKVKWADINVDNKNDISTYRLKLKKGIVKQVLQLKIKRAYCLFKELHLIDRLLPEIQHSRHLNVIKNNHYLSALRTINTS